jgi:hypothetical protein
MFKKKEPNAIDVQIEVLSNSMKNYPVDSPEYAAAMEKMVVLAKTKNEGKKPIDPNTIIAVAGGLLQVVMIIGHERLHVLTSKAIGFVLKGRV